MAHDRIVIGVDFSHSGRSALEAGTALARDLGAQAVVVHAMQDIQAPGLDPMHPTKQDTETLSLESEAMHQLQNEWIPRMQEEGVDVRLRPGGGDPVATILEEIEASEAGLAVVGTHRPRGIGHAIAGSVAQELVRRSPTPVLVVPERAED